MSSLITRRISGTPRLFRPTTWRRLESTSAVTRVGFQGNLFTHTVAGIAGGATVLVGAYTWYHFSGLRTYVAAGKNAREMFRQTTQNLSDRARRHPNEALKYLRAITKSYVAVIPGASVVVDGMFDRLDETYDVHNEEVNSIAMAALEDIGSVTAGAGSINDPKTALKVMDILKRRIGQLTDVGVRAGGHALKPLMDQYPTVQEKIGDSYEQMRVLSERKGAEAKAMVEDTTQQLKAKLARGVSSESLDLARSMINSRISKIKDMPDQTSAQALPNNTKDDNL